MRIIQITVELIDFPIVLTLKEIMYLATEISVLLLHDFCLEMSALKHNSCVASVADWPFGFCKNVDA